MRCRTCTYPLWNITARQCPECGAAFKPSDQDFVPNSVRFCCPHCMQSYYGTGAKGHLEPSSFTCVSCSRPITMDECILLPTEGVAEEQTKPVRMPWLERADSSIFKAWWQTTVMSMSAPVRLMKATPVETSGWRAFWYAALTSTGYNLFSVVPCCLFLALVPFFAGAGGGGRGGALNMLGVLAVMAAGTIVFNIAYIGIWILSTHGLLRLTGPTPHTTARTSQALSYSCGPYVLAAIPVLGLYITMWVGWIWWMVAAILMLREGQKVSGKRAAFAVLTFPILCIIIVVGGYVGLMVWGLNQAQTAAAAAAASARQATTAGVSQVHTSLGQVRLTLVEQFEQKGSWPDHPLRIITDGGKTASEFYPSMSMPWQSSQASTSWALGTITLSDFYYLSRQEQSEYIYRLRTTYPGTHAAILIGEVIFTYEGLPKAGGEADDAWVLVHASPDGTYTAMPLVGEPVPIGAEELSVAVEEQNELRARLNLPLLPDLTTLTPENAYSGAPAP